MSLTLDALAEVEREAFGKTGFLSEAKKGIGALAPEDRKDAGRAINEIRGEVEVAVG